MEHRAGRFAAFAAAGLILMSTTAHAKFLNHTHQQQRSPQINLTEDCSVERLLTGCHNEAGNTPADYVESTHSGQVAPRVGTFEARSDSFLQQSGYEYKKVKANSWFANLQGQNIPKIRIIIGAGSNSLAVGAVVTPKRSLRLTTDFLFKMLKLSYDLNYVRVCFDPDDDLLVMSQLKDRWIDFNEFKATLEQVAAAADRTYGEVRPFLNTP